MPETTATTAVTNSTATTPTLASIPRWIQMLSIIFIIGAVRGAILLIKDARKHKGFSKIIRRITGIIQLLAIIGSIIMTIIIYSGILTTGLKILGILMLIVAGIGFLSIITNIRGGILLFIESARKKKFDKWIRIVCGIIMIINIIFSLIFNI